MRKVRNYDEARKCGFRALGDQIVDNEIVKFGDNKTYRLSFFRNLTPDKCFSTLKGIKDFLNKNGYKPSEDCNYHYKKAPEDFCWISVEISEKLRINIFNRKEPFNY